MAVDQSKANAVPYSIAHIENMGFDPLFQVPVNEVLGYDGKNIQRLNASNLRFEVEYDGSNNPIYIGIAAPGTVTSESKWMVKKLAWDGNNNLTSLKFAGGASEFDQVWDNRGSLSYS